MNKIKLIAIDIDGTLLSTDREVSRKNKEAIARALSKGIHVVLATGRMYSSARQFGYLLPEAMPIIAYNGALIRELNDGKIYFQQNMPNEDALIVDELIRPYGLMANFYVEDQLYAHKDNSWIQGYSDHVKVPHHTLRKGELEELAQANKIIKMAAMGEEEKIDWFLKQEYEKLESRLYVVKSLPFFLEFAHRDVNKGTGLKALGEILGISTQEMMAIGDNMNDLEMLELAGYPVVMGNGNPALKERGWHVTTGNDEDGVAEAINLFTA